MKKLSKKIVSFALAATMAFSTLIVNTAFVPAASLDTSAAIEQGGTTTVTSGSTTITLTAAQKLTEKKYGSDIQNSTVGDMTGYTTALVSGGVNNGSYMPTGATKASTARIVGAVSTNAATDVTLKLRVAAKKKVIIYKSSENVAATINADAPLAFAEGDAGIVDTIDNTADDTNAKFTSSTFAAAPGEYFYICGLGTNPELLDIIASDDSTGSPTPGGDGSPTPGGDISPIPGGDGTTTPAAASNADSLINNEGMNVVVIPEVVKADNVTKGSDGNYEVGANVDDTFYVDVVVYNNNTNGALYKNYTGDKTVNSITAFLDYDPEVVMPTGKLVEPDSSTVPTFSDGTVALCYDAGKKFGNQPLLDPIDDATLADLFDGAPTVGTEGYAQAPYVADGTKTTKQIGRIKIAVANMLTGSPGTLPSDKAVVARFEFKVLKKAETPMNITFTTGTTNEGERKGLSYSISTDAGTKTFLGDDVNVAIKIADAVETTTEESTETTTETTTEETTEATTEETTEETTVETTTETTTVEETSTETTTSQTTTKKSSSSSSGGGSSRSSGGSSSSKASGASSGSTTTGAPKSATSASGTKGGSTSGSSSKSSVTSASSFVAPNGTVITAPALKDASGNVYAGSNIPSSILGKNTFGDTASRAWAQNSIEKLAALGIINGVGNGSFAPDAYCKRADFIVMLVKTLGLTGTATDNFDDVVPGKYYTNAVGLAKEAGIATGYGDGNFGPEKTITRQDMMVLVAKTVEFLGEDITASTSVLDKFADAGQMAGYAKPFAAYLVTEGMVSGTGANIEPTALMTRAQLAVLVDKLYDKVVELSPAIEEETVAEESSEETTEDESAEATTSSDEETTEASTEETTETTTEA